MIVHRGATVVALLLVASLAIPAVPAHAQPAALVQAKVKDARDRPVVGATVTVQAANGQTVRATTDAAGLATLTVPRGAATLSAAATGFDPSSPVRISVPASGPVPVVLTQKALVVRVQVSDQQGRPIPNVSVRAAGSAGRAEGRTDGTGAAMLSLPAGVYTFIAQGVPGFKPVELVNQQVATSRSVSLVLATAESPIRVTVQNTNRLPVAGARVLAQTVAQHRIVGQAVTDGNGLTTFKVPPGDYEIVVTAPGYVPRTAGPVTVSAGGPNAVSVMLSVQAVSVGVTVTDERGAPLAGASVTASSGNTGTSSTTTDARGATWLPVTAGTWDFTASLAGYGTGKAAGVRVPGTSAVTIKLTRSADMASKVKLRITVQERGGARPDYAVIKVTAQDGTVVRGTTNRGDVTLEVNAGKQRVEIVKPGYRSEPLEFTLDRVPAGTVVSRTLYVVNVAPEQAVEVQSRIARGQWGAERQFGSFTVPPNGEARGFASTEPQFQIYAVENGRERVYFDRSPGQERPLPLAQLTLGPGTYIFSIPGGPGASGRLSLKVRTP